jgi:anti-sigma factor RsiW
MRCRQARHAIDSLTCARPQDEALERHAADCPKCRRELERQRALLSLLAGAGEVECPDLAPRVLRRLRAPSPWPTVGRWAAAALLAAGFMGLGYLVGRMQTSIEPQQASPGTMMASYSEALNTAPLASFERVYATASPDTERASLSRSAP